MTEFPTTREISIEYELEQFSHQSIGGAADGDVIIEIMNTLTGYGRSMYSSGNFGSLSAEGGILLARNTGETSVIGGECA